MEADLQISNANLWLPKRKGTDQELGMKTHTTIYKIDDL